MLDTELATFCLLSCFIRSLSGWSLSWSVILQHRKGRLIRVKFLAPCHTAHKCQYPGFEPKKYGDMGFLGGTSSKEPACQWRKHKRCGFDPWVRKIPWRRRWQPAPVFLPGNSHGERNLAATVYRVAKSWTRLKRLTHIHSTRSLVPEALWYGPSEETCAEGTQRRTYIVL